MSGPTTVVIATEPLTAILAASAIRAARAVREGYREAAELQDAFQDQQAKSQGERRAASAEEASQLQAQLAAQHERHVQLCALAAPLGLSKLPELPAAPSDVSIPALARHIAQNQTLLSRFEAALQAVQPAASEAHTQGIAVPAEASSEVEVSPEPMAATALRLLARLADLGPIPPEIDALAEEIAATPPGERQQLLTLELRRAIQLFEENAAREASALILEETLMDLGYQVEAVSETLFVEGGVVHFRRPGWGDYQVRLRVNAREGTANFNVIRAVAAGENERSVLDHIAEDRWCAEFPALMQALAARGLSLEVTRRLGAGELPVQLVDREKLPRFADEERPASTSAPLQKEIR